MISSRGEESLSTIEDVDKSINTQLASTASTDIDLVIPVLTRGGRGKQERISSDFCSSIRKMLRMCN